MSDISVLVAGGGPIGLAMAGELRRRGVPFRAIERAARRTDLSKALVIWPRTLELLRLAGCADDFTAVGRPTREAQLRANGRLIAEISFAGIATPYPYALFIPQSETERLLEEHLERLGGRLERTVELTSFEPGQNGVACTLTHADGRIERVTCDYLVGCDGAHSVVRHGLKIDFAGATEPAAFMLGDVKLDGAVEDKLQLYWHREGVLGIFPMQRGRFRVIADLGPATAAPQEATLDLIQSALDRRGPRGVRAYDPVWLSLFRINDRKVSDYRHGRVFLTGDAAHIHSPAGGQGMNTGIQDAFNLAWKLALTIKGKSGDRLLATYSPERSAVGDRVLRNAARLTQLATLHQPAAQAIRNQVVALLMRFAPVRRAFARTMTELDIRYPRSALSQGRPSKALRPGDRAPDAAATIDGRRRQLFDVLNRDGFTVLAVGAAEAPGAVELAARFMPWVKAVPVLAEGEMKTRYGTGVYVIRPDWYVGLIARAGGYDKAERYLTAWLRS
ncbi:MAG TPA: FAD-dependent monooxygenase [Stellaceae bacterium]|nr:FAD-dependent monooxygenase [Stellaceae bacterium]